MDDKIQPLTYLLSDDEFNIIKTNLNELQLKLMTFEESSLDEIIPSLGYQFVAHEGGRRIQTERGMVVTPFDRTFNDGFYIFRNDSGAYLLEVLKPNTIDKSELITTIIQTADNLLSQINVSDLEIYDLTQVYAHLLVNQVIRPMARHIYPDDPVKQEHFARIYLPRFMANAARYYIGDTTLIEEAVNAEPHVIRVAIDGSEDLIPNPNFNEDESGGHNNNDEETK